MYMQVQCLANLENEEPLEIYYSLYDAKSQSFLSLVFTLIQICNETNIP